MRRFLPVMNTRGRGKKAKEPDPLPPHEEEEIEADEGKAARFSRTSIQHRYWLLEAEAANNFTMENLVLKKQLYVKSFYVAGAMIIQMVSRYLGTRSTPRLMPKS